MASCPCPPVLLPCSLSISASMEAPPHFYPSALPHFERPTHGASCSVHALEQIIPLENCSRKLHDCQLLDLNAELIDNATLCEIGSKFSKDERLHLPNLVRGRLDGETFSMYRDSGIPVGRLQASLDRLERYHTKPDADICASLLRECIKLNAFSEGRRVHACIIRTGHEREQYLGNILVEMYDKCGSLQEAIVMFDNLNVRNAYSWNNIIAAYTHHGYGKEALHVLKQMRAQSVEPNKFTFSTVLVACASEEALAEGKGIHVDVIYNGFDSDTVLETALINMYGKCGSSDDAQRVFDKMYKRNVISWTAMIATYVQTGQGKEAIQLFRCMLGTGEKPDEFCLSAILGMCSGPAMLEEGKWIHVLTIESGLELDVNVGTALVHMYGNCGNLEGGSCVFGKMHARNVVLYTAMITSYSQLGHGEEALQLFRQMLQDGIMPNKVTFISVLTACAGSATLTEGRWIYDSVVDSGLESNCVVASAIVNMFGKCGCPGDARKVFDKMPERNVVTWNAIIAAYVEQGDWKEAVQLFHLMESEGVVPTAITFVSGLSACASLSAVDEGKLIHASIAKNGLELQLTIGNALVSMYGKCGNPEAALVVFSKMHEHDVISWNAMIAAYTQHGHYTKAFQLFERMQLDEVRPNEITFVSILSACSRAGLVLEGLHYFFSISRDHGMNPTMEHYGCIIDLLGRAGQLAKAEEFINKMPLSPDVVAWKSFLGACRIHGDVERGLHAAERAFKIDPQEAPSYVLLANMYAADELCDEVSKGKRVLLERVV